MPLDSTGCAPVSQLRWYAVQVDAGHERAIMRRNYVEQLGLDLYLPMVGRSVIRRGAPRPVQWALFPGYLFAHADLSDPRRPIWRLCEAANVTGLVRAAGGAIVSVRGADMDHMRELTLETGAMTPRQASEFTVGTWVRVNDGPFTSFPGMVEAVHDPVRTEVNGVVTYEQEIVVGVQIFGRTTPVRLRETQVTKVDPADLVTA